MCGIAGLLSPAAGLDDAVARMTGAIAHRGPDGSGAWADAEAGVGLGHRRLAVVELSEAGHQPMVSANGRWVLTCNGEFYNHAELRRLYEQEVGPRDWRGHSDMETFVEAVAAWGLDKTLERCVGMWAFALWDRETRELHLCRDRFGEKPLYYGWANGEFLFASELKAIRSRPGFANPVSREALTLYAARTYVPAPLSIYERIFKLPPGTILTVTPEIVRAPMVEPPAEGAGRALSLRAYWRYRDVVAAGLADPITDEGDALERLEAALRQSLAGQSMADVPIGAFLSGGIDSSAIVALYQKYSALPVRTFSIGFEDAAYDEAVHARAVAAHFGTVHDERIVTVSETRDVIPSLPHMYDEPFADSSQIPTHLVSRFAREQVTVAISGDGGDELFGGYNRYVMAVGLWNRINRMPWAMRAGIGATLGMLPADFWGGVLRASGRGSAQSGTKVRKGLRTVARARSVEEMLGALVDEWAGELSPVRGAVMSRHGGFDGGLGGSAPAAVSMMYADAVAYLPDDIMAKVDRASMAVALETRAPYLDHRVAEVAAAIPIGMKIAGGTGKAILRNLLFREAPKALFDRPKSGFAIPVGAWIKGPLRPWAEELLDPRRMAAEGYFDAAIVQRRWADHLSGRRDSTPAIWAILMFQAWLRAQEESVAAAA